MDRRTEPTRNALFLKTKLAIARRLDRSCRHLDAREFDALVDRMALLEIKYSMRRGELVMPRATHSKG
jgi:hypothetical protein